MIPTLWTAVTRDGRIYGIPIEASPSAIHYQVSKLREAGLSLLSELETDAWTWDEFANYGRKLSRDYNGDGELDQWGFSMVWDTRGWGIFLRSAGGRIFDDLSKPTRSMVNSEAGLESLEFLRDLVRGEIMYPENFGAGIRDPRMAMSLDGTWAVNATISAGVEFESWITPRHPRSGFGNWVEQQSLFIFDNRDEAKIEAAWQFLEWFYSTEVHGRWAVGTGYFPVLTSALNIPEVQDYFGSPQFQGHLLIMSLGYGTVAARLTNSKGRQALQAADISAVLPRVYLGEIPAASALVEMERRMNAALQ